MLVSSWKAGVASMLAYEYSAHEHTRCKTQKSEKKSPFIDMKVTASAGRSAPGTWKSLMYTTMESLSSGGTGPTLLSKFLGMSPGR